MLLNGHIDLHYWRCNDWNFIQNLEYQALVLSPSPYYFNEATGTSPPLGLQDTSEVPSFSVLKGNSVQELKNKTNMKSAW